MSARPRIQAKTNPAVAYHAEERAILRNVQLRALTALEQMYAYFGADRG
ncbi:hypothetical protein G5B31_04310 [Rhodobacter sp. SGA-6-6]|nr:hypothetical protein [Rhodobacter sp. SGA-6-6]NGM44752.1 hypothetical protein [Rhodobacter sp. SGA-6-6]